MTSNTAKSYALDPNHKSVVFVIYPEIALLDLTGPLQVLFWARKAPEAPRAYDVALTSLHGGRVMSDTLVSIDTEPLSAWDGRDIDTLIIVGGDGVYQALQAPDLIAQVTALAGKSRRVCSICSGALLLAATGLLNGRRAVTHWDDTEALKRSFPKVDVESDPIYVKDGHIWTSAGVTAGTDMALALVAEDLGHDAALNRARALVTYMVRPGGQSQFSPALARQHADRSARFEPLHAWIAGNLSADLRVNRLADRENMSVRNFHRLYTSTMGMTPAKGVETLRLQAARDMLETSRASVKSIAAQAGFGDEENMRRAFQKHVGVSPTGYRQRFQISAGL